MIRAKDVTVAKIFQAHCWIEGCGWHGEPFGSFGEANTERQAHLEEHRQRETGGRP